LYIPPLIDGHHAARIGAAMAMPVDAPGMAEGIETELSVFICFTNRCGSNFSLICSASSCRTGGGSLNAPPCETIAPGGYLSFDGYCRRLQ
jgi:hypothetical protein